eukprot:1023746-Prymnesium_polylepis.1
MPSDFICMTLAANDPSLSGEMASMASPTPTRGANAASRAACSPASDGGMANATARQRRRQPAARLPTPPRAPPPTAPRHP